jgi:RNA 2',3'-cyclic 3'-phosphodiesterase
MRLFFGIYPPDTVVEEAAAIRDRVQEHVRDDRARWVKTAQLHITLQFLGDHESDAEAIAAARSLAHAPFRIALSGIGDFGHVYWLGVAHGEPLIALANDLGAALRARGFVLDDRPYHPHLTLARVRRAKRVELEAQSSPFDVREFALIESRSGQYATRATFPLRAREGDEHEQEPAGGERE